MSTPSKDRYAVIGNPIGHSKSPQIHTQFAEQTDQDLTYEALLAPLDGFDAQVREFAIDGGKGLNVTVPFKLDAYQFSDELSPRAERAAAVNTLIKRDDGSFLGDNTDGAGLARDLEHNHAVALAGTKILILGAGGAVQGVLGPILDAKPDSIVVANRTVEKAVALANQFSNDGNIQGCGLNELGTQTFDLIINGTAASLNGQVPAIPDTLLNKNACCYDMMYSSEPTAFVRWAIEHHAGKALDGLGMLVEQAAESFYLWRGVRPETSMVIKSLRP
ncbi:MAG TPA: shikimate dehydrogenase [Chromatiaceae bacterium]|nr:shikimate dehydrogenase [Chromatiaceae bacterium]